MNDNPGSKSLNDELGCIGDFNPQDKKCYRRCPLSLRCIMECNRRERLEQFMDFLEFEDIGPADLH